MAGSEPRSDAQPDQPADAREPAIDNPASCRPTGPRPEHPDGSEGDRPLWREPHEGEEQFSLGRVFGGWNGALDAGLPSIAFLVTYTVSGRNLQLALIMAVALGAAVALVRIVTKKPLQNVLAGFLAVAVAAFIAHRTGRAEDYYLPGLLINAGYCAAYVIANVVRYPIIGLVVGLAAGWGLSWRKDPVLLRAFTRAGWLWAAGFALRLVVQGPLYLAGEVVALGIARLVMGWPMFGVIIALTYIVIKGSVPPERWRTLRMSVNTLADRRGAGGSA